MKIMAVNVALLAIGANLHNAGVAPVDTLRMAVNDIELAGFSVKSCSRLYQTPAFPAGSGPDYVNAALHVLIANQLTPQAVFSPLGAIENKHGRLRAQRWGGRTLDIDLLALGDLVLPDLAGFAAWAGLDPAAQAQCAPDQLILPHPRLHERAFVLTPLMDIAPDWRHPVFGRTVRQMHADLPAADRAAVTVLANLR
jgi:2-amino-4-hydroxy-6-hydroxymethyldihydropteridine diphosphokinase